MIDKRPGLWIYPDGRERIITKTEAGKRIMTERWKTAWRDSQGVCCLCHQSVTLSLASLEHKTAKGSGGGKHDDRQENLAISHIYGNIAKGSQRLEQYLKLPLETRVRNCQSQR